MCPFMRFKLTINFVSWSYMLNVFSCSVQALELNSISGEDLKLYNLYATYKSIYDEIIKDG
jgi:hypothetical protein